MTTTTTKTSEITPANGSPPVPPTTEAEQLAELRRLFILQMTEALRAKTPRASMLAVVGRFLDGSPPVATQVATKGGGLDLSKLPRFPPSTVKADMERRTAASLTRPSLGEPSTGD